MDTMTKRETLTAGDILHCGWGCCLLPNCFVFLSNPML